MSGTSEHNQACIALTRLAHDIIELVLIEHRNIDQQLDDVSQLTADACNTLVPAFERISQCCDQLLDVNSPTDRQNCRNDIRHHQQQVITALQFDDIVQQLAKHTQARTRLLLAILEQLLAGFTEIENSDYQYTEMLDASVESLKREIEGLRQELAKERPVKQRSLNTGNTELF